MPTSAGLRTGLFLPTPCTPRYTYTCNQYPDAVCRSCPPAEGARRGLKMRAYLPHVAIMSRGLECIQEGKGAGGHTREGFRMVPLASSTSSPPSLHRLAPFYIQRRGGATDASEGRLKCRESQQFVYQPALASAPWSSSFFPPPFFRSSLASLVLLPFPLTSPLLFSASRRRAASESVDPPRSHYEAIKAKSINVCRLVLFLLERSIATRRSLYPPFRPLPPEEGEGNRIHLPFNRAASTLHSSPRACRGDFAKRPANNNRSRVGGIVGGDPI